MESGTSDQHVSSTLKADTQHMTDNWHAASPFGLVRTSRIYQETLYRWRWCNRGAAFFTKILEAIIEVGLVVVVGPREVGRVVLEG